MIGILPILFLGGLLPSPVINASNLAADFSFPQVPLNLMQTVLGYDAQVIEKAVNQYNRVMCDWKNRADSERDPIYYDLPVPSNVQLQPLVETMQKLLNMNMEFQLNCYRMSSLERESKYVFTNLPVTPLHKTMASAIGSLQSQLLPLDTAASIISFEKYPLVLPFLKLGVDGAFVVIAAFELIAEWFCKSFAEKWKLFDFMDTAYVVLKKFKFRLMSGVMWSSRFTEAVIGSAGGTGKQAQSAQIQRRAQELMATSARQWTVPLDHLYLEEDELLQVIKFIVSELPASLIDVSVLQGTLEKSTIVEHIRRKQEMIMTVQQATSFDELVEHFAKTRDYSFLLGYSNQPQLVENDAYLRTCLLGHPLGSKLDAILGSKAVRRLPSKVVVTSMPQRGAIHNAIAMHYQIPAFLHGILRDRLLPIIDIQQALEWERDLFDLNMDLSVISACALESIDIRTTFNGDLKRWRTVRTEMVDLMNTRKTLQRIADKYGGNQILGRSFISSLVQQSMMSMRVYTVQSQCDAHYNISEYAEADGSLGHLEYFEYLVVRLVVAGSIVTDCQLETIVSEALLRHLKESFRLYRQWWVFGGGGDPVDTQIQSMIFTMIASSN